jgi:predicted ester cyclase
MPPPELSRCPELQVIKPPHPRLGGRIWVDATVSSPLKRGAFMSKTTDYRKKIERLYIDGNMGGDLTAVDDTVHTEYVYHGAAGIGPGPEGLKASIRAGRAAVSDVEMVIDDFIVEGDQSVVRYTLRGTHTGEWAGAPATGNRLDYSGIAIYRWAEGKIIEEWDYFEETKLLRTLGLLPDVAAPRQG